ncbi:methionine aminopeptidase [Daldinia caldariorum]|uniref:methionine aminopeptidase n=1 Tax=Daldinia caldariorum TaxID=326644 RepID=UPI00200771F8|nr:methionine aminopeptidase [Daldinia caldariorum]KAI1469804.1 methionine aminopeptidase [Daldinia caldariorum]
MTVDLVKKTCLSPGCENEAESLQCPTCLKLGIENSYFCSQDCFKSAWAEHKKTHKAFLNGSQNATGTYNPFTSFYFTGPLRPVYPLSPRRQVPKTIRHPDYAKTGIPTSELKLARNKIDILDDEGQEAMRKVCRLGREVLDLLAAEVRPGITTDYLDELCHKLCIERDSYPSPLNYKDYPKSFCTSINEVICHGIPDQRVLVDGDIINLDVSLYHGGYHADLNETYYVGDKAKADPDTVRVVETARECLEEAIKVVKPGYLVRDFGAIIEKYAKSKGCSVVRDIVGHGVNIHFHSPPNVPHYARNKAVGVCKAGMTFTIEPMVSLGKHQFVTWPDNWTITTIDGKKSAQFEHTLLVTETGVEVLTARLPTSPGGAIRMPEVA